MRLLPISDGKTVCTGLALQHMYAWPSDPKAGCRLMALVQSKATMAILQLQQMKVGAIC